MKILVFCVLAALVSAGGFASKSPTDSVEEDAKLNMTQLLTKYGYPVEEHTVQTSDGYLLQVYRIPYGRKCGPGLGKKTPVLVQHGMFSSSYDWIILGPTESLGYKLADSCYDVWMGNNRGNSLSRRHIELTTKDPSFWQFSWHEMGVYDLPAMVDYILKKTQRPGLHYIGHSQGTTQFFVFASLLPAYHKKIITMQALSPVVYMSHLKSPPVRFLVKHYDAIVNYTESKGIYDFSPECGFLNKIGSKSCKEKFPKIQKLCCNVMFLLAGIDEEELNKTMIPAIIAHTPAGASTKQLMHYAQEIKSGYFRYFDYGPKNVEMYGCESPPIYDVTHIKVPVALYYGLNDWLASVKDVLKLARELLNVIKLYPVPYPKFNHLDFIVGTKAMGKLYAEVIGVLDQF